MNKIVIWCTGLALAGAAAGLGQSATARTIGAHAETVGSLGRAIEVPGLGALNTGGYAAVSSVSCASAGSCAAGGYYTLHDGKQGAFVADERNGRWGKAIELPGFGTLNTGAFAEVNEVSCGSAGNCTAGGYYSASHGQQGFVADERNGVWGTAIEVPGLGALNKAGNAAVSSVSCDSAGNCVAGGYYSSSQLGERGFVVVERNGVWGTASEVPGLAALDKDVYSQVTSVSCASAGTCAAGGYYTFHGGDQGAFVTTERNSVWAKAIQVPGLAALNTDELASVSSVSCGSAGSCTAAGGYAGRHGDDEGFVAVERKGVWGKAIQLPDPGGISKPGEASVLSVSCGSAGNCAAGGFFAYLAPPRHHHGFLATERNGRWGKAILVPGLAVLNKAGKAEVQAVSCASAGNCAAGGYYFDRPHHFQWFVVAERNGRWGTAMPVPGFSALNNKRTDGLGISDQLVLSCAPAGGCAAGGYYVGASGGHQGFVTQAG